MCGELDRLVTVQALKSYLETLVGRPGDEEADHEEVRTRLEELAVINDELESLLANPRLAAGRR